MLYVLPLEPLEERYTIQWERWFKDRLTALNVDFVLIHGLAMGSYVQHGTVLDAVGTSYWKATQMMAVATFFKANLIKDGDIFFTFDVWYPGLESIRYMATLLNIKVKIFGFLHAGSYTIEDFAAPMESWAQHFERGWIYLCDKVFVGSGYHATSVRCRLELGHRAKIVVTGNPFNSHEVRHMAGTIKPVTARENIVIFSHRFDREKRPDVFMDAMDKLWDIRQDFTVVVTTSRPTLRSNDPSLLVRLANVKFPVIVREGLTKGEYYHELAKAKVFVSTTVEENFGYCLVEAVAMGCHPLVPYAYSHPEILRTDPLFLWRTTEELVGDIGRALDSPVSCPEYADRYNRSVDHIIDEMLHD